MNPDDPYVELFHEHLQICNIAESNEKVDELVKLTAVCSIRKKFIHIHVNQNLYHVVYKRGYLKIDKNIEKVISSMSGYVGSIMVPLKEVGCADDVAKIVKITFDHEEDWNTTDIYIVATDDDNYGVNMNWNGKQLAKSARKYAKYYDYIPRANHC